MLLLLDIREFLVTNETSQNASPLLFETQKRVKELDPTKTYITQGFIGRCLGGKTRTLGREGSDYTGAILSWCIDARSLTIWKDVEGIHSCDPSKYGKSGIIKKMSYKNASTLARLGAKVIFPRTMEPLENKGISLFVRSIFSGKAGTEISDKSEDFFSVTSKDFQNEKLVSVVFSPGHPFSQKCFQNHYKAPFYEQGPDFVSFKVSKQIESDLVQRILDSLNKADCK